MTRPGARRRALLSGLLAVAVLATACGSGDNGGTAAAAAELEEATSASSSAGRRPTADDPLRVMMAGDSLMAEVSLPIVSSVQDGGRARARLVEAPSVPRDGATREQWRRRLARFDPELILVLIGVWEGMATGALSQDPLGSQAWERTYRDRLLDPYLELLTSRGARVVWIGMPPVPDARRQRGFTAMNRAVRHLADQSTELTYLPGDRILARADGTWTAFLPGPNGNPQRVRRLDTTHLCADGALRLARPVLQHVQRQWAIPVAPGWADRDWRRAFPLEECPRA